eukprot:3418954-Amphidinium_carterae.1
MPTVLRSRMPDRQRTSAKRECSLRVAARCFRVVKTSSSLRLLVEANSVVKRLAESKVLKAARMQFCSGRPTACECLR